MVKRIVGAFLAVAALMAALVVAVKLEAVRPNMLFEPAGAKGIDASAYQGALDFDVPSDAGIEFVYAKATEGASYIDEQFAATYGEASGSSVALGVGAKNGSQKESCERQNTHNSDVGSENTSPRESCEH